MIDRTLSHYKVLEEISRGGMGIVYKALDLKLNREVALKVLPPELVSDPDRKRRFVQEAQAAAALKHPNIAVVVARDLDRYMPPAQLEGRYSEQPKWQLGQTWLAGRMIFTVVPAPSTLLSSISPPKLWMMLLQLNSPQLPVVTLPSATANEGSNIWSIPTSSRRGDHSWVTIETRRERTSTPI